MKGLHTTRSFPTRNGRNTVGDVVAKVDLANKFCEGCPAKVEKEGTFPACKEGVSTSVMVQAGDVLVSDIRPLMNCLRGKES